MYRPPVLINPPTVEPVSLAEAKAWARIDGTDDDTTLTSLIAAARQNAEEYLRRSLLAQTWRVTLDAVRSGLNDLPEGVYSLPVTALYGDLPRAVALPRGPVVSIASVTTYNSDGASAVLDPSLYRVDAAGERFLLNSSASWPGGIRPEGGVEITYVAGYGTTAAAVPQPIRTGILIHVASLYEQRGLCEDAIALPPGTAQLYDRYRVMGGRRG